MTHVRYWSVVYVIGAMLLAACVMLGIALYDAGYLAAIQDVTLRSSAQCLTY